MTELNEKNPRRDQINRLVVMQQQKITEFQTQIDKEETPNKQ